MFPQQLSVRRIPSYQRQWNLGLSQEVLQPQSQQQLMPRSILLFTPRDGLQSSKVFQEPHSQLKLPSSPRPQTPEAFQEWDVQQMSEPKLKLSSLPQSPQVSQEPCCRLKLQPKIQPNIRLPLQSSKEEQESPLEQMFKGKSGDEVVQLLSTVLTPTQLGAISKIFSRRNAVNKDIIKGVPRLRRSLGTVDRAALLSAIRCTSSLRDFNMQDFKVLPRLSVKELQNQKVTTTKSASLIATSPRSMAPTSTLPNIASPVLAQRPSLQKPATIRAELDWLKFA